MNAEPPRPETLVIAPGIADEYYWRDIWRYRRLFIVLAWRDLSVRYKQTIVGLAWALLQPLLTMIVFTIVFSKLAKLPTDGTTPYALMVYAGMLPWLLISSSLLGTANSVINNANLVSKVYFPRLIVPVSSLVVSIVDFMIGFIVLAVLMLWYRAVPNWHVVTLPLFMIMAIFVSIGPGLWAASLNVKYRDFRYIIPFFVQFGLYASPIGFSSSIVPEKWRLLYSLNPAVSVIDGFRWALLGSPPPYLPGLWVSCGVILLFLWLGLYQFRKMEKNFADLI